MPVTGSVIGLSIGQESVQAVAIDIAGHVFTLLAIGEFPNEFASTTMKQEEAVSRFSSHIFDFIRSHALKSRSVSVALDTTNLFLNTFPAGSQMSQAEINDHMNWELAQYFPEIAPREYISDTHTLVENQAERWRELLSVSVRRTEVDAITKSMTRLGLTLNIIDVDHFSAETALRINYPDTNTKYLALVGIKPHRLDVSLLKKGVMESYSYLTVDTNDEIVERFGIMSRDTRGIFSIVAYGPHLDKDLLTDIRRGSSMLVEALNPLRRVNVASSLNLTENLPVLSYRFASAVGVALRRE